MAKRSDFLPYLDIIKGTDVRDHFSAFSLFLQSRDKRVITLAKGVWSTMSQRVGRSLLFA